MNKDELYKLLSEKKSLSINEMNKMLTDSKNVDRSKLEELDREALEGWTESGVDRIDMSRVSRKLGFSQSKLYFFLGGIGAIVILIVLLWSSYDSNNNVTKKTKSQPKLIEQTDIYISEKFDTLKEEQKTTRIEIRALKKTQRSQPKIEITIDDRAPVFIVDDLPIKPIASSTKNEAIKIEMRKKIKEVYFYTFKLVDYRAIRSKPSISTQQMDLTGTSANLEKDENQEEVLWQSVDVPYIEYIKKTMYYMDKGSLKNALARFDIILSSYPDDINAQFYAGFAFYNLNEFDKAQDRFLATLKNGISNFDEEAMWYLALSYERSGQTNKANEIFKTIANSDSFYSDRAKKKLGD